MLDSEHLPTRLRISLFQSKRYTLFPPQSVKVISQTHLDLNKSFMSANNPFTNIYDGKLTKSRWINESLIILQQSDNQLLMSSTFTHTHQARTCIFIYSFKANMSII